MEVEYSSRLNEVIMELLPGLHRFINPIVNRAEYNGIRLLKNHIKIIAVLDIEKSLTPGGISIRLDIQKGSLTRMLKTLLNLDLVCRTDDPDDDRKYYLSLTENGKAFFFEHKKNCDYNLNLFFNGLNDTDKNKIETGLHLLRLYFKTKGEDSEKC